MNKTTVDEIMKAMDGIHFFITGTTRWGIATPESDIDVVVCVDKVEDVKNKLAPSLTTSWEASSYNNGSKATIGGKVFNIIPLHPRDYVAWYIAAKMVDNSLYCKKSIRDKNVRHGFHEVLVGLVKATLPDVNTKNMYDFIRE